MEILNLRKLSLIKQVIEYLPLLKIKNLKKGNGYPHIDAYNLKDNHFVTLWVPMVGFSEKYTMLIAPKSHKTLHNKKQFHKKKITYQEFLLTIIQINSNLLDRD